ncbi:dual oxidase 1-like [Bufo gargarizans]|uniref:dual oxidase 1-like n=1 Tax=Bufo gargarizans TaxID=30331 RepID=UPI001CF2CCA1|nr:dual oxidase 1-like [Bufo gargarizans]
MTEKLFWLFLIHSWMCFDVAQMTVNWEIQRYDGWYNNLAYHSMGSKGSKLMRLIPASYSDGVYQVAKEPELPNPREISNTVMKGESGRPSSRNLTVMAVFFGYHVLSEIVSTEMPACPAEFLNINIPVGDPVFDPEKRGNVVLPFQRIQWSKDSGKSPNNPRNQINTVTAWIDGSSIYGSSHSWSDALRSFSGGKLASEPEGVFPPYATQSLPMWRVPDPSTGKTGNDGIYSFGNAMGNESPFIQAESLVWFRYHNFIANELAKKNSDWSDEVLFQNARKWVIATYQNIVFYEWLPTFFPLSQNLTEYNGYKQHVDPSISPEFLALTSLMLYTMTPSGVYMRDEKCTLINVKNRDGGKSSALRLCNNYWNRENPNLKTLVDVDNLLMGMCSQIAEEEDHIVVSDLRDYWYGQIKYSRTDLLASSILRGRDMGLPSYNKLRNHYGFQPLDWDKIRNPIIREQLKALYDDDIEKLEFIPGVLSEIDGPLIAEIILSQFNRTREGDRFWFENVKNGLFTADEISNIRKTRFHDVLVSVNDAFEKATKNNVFRKNDDPCVEIHQLKSDDMEKCVPLMVTDYFEGCAAGFGITIAALCCLPIVSLIIALLVARYRKQTFLKMQPKTEDSGVRKMNNREGFQASEWCGGDEPFQQVFIQLHPNQVITVLDGTKSNTRTIRLQNQQNIEVTFSNNNGSRVARVRIPKEYDLVLFFNDQHDREAFIKKLQTFFDDCGVSYTFTALRERDLLKDSISKKKRQEMLETFFRNSLSHVFDIEKQNSGVVHKQEISEALKCELSREEFAESLGLDPKAHFVDAMFSVADEDGNGYLSFNEFCYILCILLKDSVENKLRFMFAIYDVNETGVLTKEEFTQMLRSFNQLSNFLSRDQTEQVIDSMFIESGLQSTQEITWEQFHSMFKQHANVLSQMTFQGSTLPIITRNITSKISFIDKGTKEHTDSIGENHTDTVELEGLELRNRRGRMNKNKANQPRLFTTARREKYESSKIRQKIQQFKRLIENYRRHIVCIVIFYGISAGLFAERGYYYGFASPGTGISDTTYVGLIVSRGAAASISFMYSYILLTMCRNLITFLRETFLNQYIPFDAAVDFHRLVAMSALVLSILHTVGHLVNVYIFSITPLSVLSCLFPTVFSDNGSEFPNKYYWWFFETVPGMTGVLLLAIMALMYVFSSYYFRRVSFRGFWIIHHLYVLFYILIIIHGSFALIQQPKFHIYFIAPAIIFVFDKLISLRRKKIEIDVLEAKQLPSGVTSLKFQRPSDFDYKSGQWVRIACLSLGTDEYHPFTLTSAPHEETLSLHIRAVGPWTTSLRQICSSPSFPKLFLDGPFGEGHQEWNKFEVSVLVGGGIGVTPFASILKDLVFKSSVNARIQCKKIYFIWVTRTQRQFEWLTDIIKEVEEKDSNDLLSVHIYITQLSEKFDFRTAMLYICERHFQKVQSRSLMTGLRSVTHFGRPPFLGFLNSLQDVHPEVKKIGVFSCGPPGMTKNVEDACKKLNKRDQAHFMHHYENF